MKIKVFLLSLFLIACSTKPKHNSPNEINEPLFYPKNHASIGATIGTVLVDQSNDFFSRDQLNRIEYESGLYFKPTFSYEVNISKWANFLIWPLYWKFLLTGEQFSDGSQLKLNKIHTVIEGGVVEVAYSSRGGLASSLTFSGRVKYLPNPLMFIETDMNYLTNVSQYQRLSFSSVSTKIGAQLTDINSISLAYNWTYFHLPRFSEINHYGVVHYDDDSSTELVLRHSIYVTKNHVFGPELAFGFRNLGFSENNYYKLGCHYRYNFF